VDLQLLEAERQRRELELGINRISQPKRMPLFKLAAEQRLAIQATQGGKAKRPAKASRSETHASSPSVQTGQPAEESHRHRTIPTRRGYPYRPHSGRPFSN